MHADEPDRRYGHEIQNLSFVMRIALGMERPGAERSFENKRTVRCFYEYKPRSRNRSGPEMDIGHHGRFQRMDAVARPPLETLARAPRSAVMVLRPFCRTFYRFPRARRAVQHRRREKRNLVLGFRSLETFGLPLSGLVHRRRRRLRIRLDTRQALEPRRRNRRPSIWFTYSKCSLQ